MLLSSAQPSEPVGLVLQRRCLGASPLRLTEEMWRSKHTQRCTEEKEMGDASGRIGGFGVWTCADPEGWMGTCFFVIFLFYFFFKLQHIRLKSFCIYKK